MRTIRLLLIIVSLLISSAALGDANFWTQPGDNGSVNNSPSAGQLVHYDVVGGATGVSALLDAGQCNGWTAIVTQGAGSQAAVLNLVSFPSTDVSDVTFGTILDNGTGTDIDGLTTGLTGFYNVRGVRFFRVEVVTPAGGGERWGLHVTCIAYK